MTTKGRKVKRSELAERHALDWGFPSRGERR
jgi:hypothetical protein